MHLGGPEFLGGEAAGELLAHARAAGATTSLDILAPGDPDMLAWIAAALPHTDYLLPNDEQVLGFTGASSLVEGARALVAAGAGCVAATAGRAGRASSSPPTRRSRCRRTRSRSSTRPAAATRSRPASCAVSRSGRSLRESAQLGCATAAQVAQGLGTDAGSYTLESVEAFMASTPTRG